MSWASRRRRALGRDEASLSSSAKRLAEAGLPRRIWSRPLGGRLRQGDLVWTHVAQLRAEGSPAGPGGAAQDGYGDKTPYLGEPADIPLAEAPGLVLRTWFCWAMVLEQTCEITWKEKVDSRLLVAPVAFADKWQGSEHWSRIRQGTLLGFVYLPAMDAQTRKRLKVGEGWPLEVEAAVCLGSTTVTSTELMGEPVFGLHSDTRHYLQERLVRFWSVRGWKGAGQAQELVGKRITAVSETDESHPGEGKLFKLALENGEEDEATVGLILHR